MSNKYLYLGMTNDKLLEIAETKALETNKTALEHILNHLYGSRIGKKEEQQSTKAILQLVKDTERETLNLKSLFHLFATPFEPLVKVATYDNVDVLFLETGEAGDAILAAISADKTALESFVSKFLESEDRPLNNLFESPTRLQALFKGMSNVTSYSVFF